MAPDDLSPSPSSASHPAESSSRRGETPASPSTSQHASGKRRKLGANRTSQACTRCRSLKMKCIGATDPPCRRCRRTGANCDFVPRANAARPWSPGPYPSHTCTELWRTEVNARIKELETANARFEQLLNQLSASGVGLSLDLGPMADSPIDERGLQPSLSGPEPGPEFAGVMRAIARLKAELPTALAANDAWSPNAVGALWESFRSHMPGLHFFSGQVSFVHPTPLLAVSILYVAAGHYPAAEMARHQPAYFQAVTRAIGILAVPGSSIRGTLEDTDEGPVSAKLDDVLGIILVGLLALGWVDTVGMWVNTAYRLLLDGMAEEGGKRQNEWRGLWEGLRTIELEHSSLHLICPALPPSPPSPPFLANAPSAPTTAGSLIGELLAIMQHRMPRFVGRGLPTVWQTVYLDAPRHNRQIQAGPDDMAGIRAWAMEIDEWYSNSARATTNDTLYTRSVILLNYHLHKLFVLSIFFPLRDVMTTTPHDREELLESSRVVLKIEASGFEVWSSWDLVMITSASLILLDAWATGAALAEDLNLIQHHLNTLTNTHQVAPSLRHTLRNRLEAALQNVRTPVHSLRSFSGVSPQDMANDIANTWFSSNPSRTLTPTGPPGRQPSVNPHQHHPHNPLPPPPQPLQHSHDPRAGSSHGHPPQHAMGLGQSNTQQYIPRVHPYMGQSHMSAPPDMSYDIPATADLHEWPPFLVHFFGEGSGTGAQPGHPPPGQPGPHGPGGGPGGPSAQVHHGHGQGAHDIGPPPPTGVSVASGVMGGGGAGPGMTGLHANVMGGVRESARLDTLSPRP